MTPDQPPALENHDLVLVNPTAGGGKAADAVAPVRAFAEGSGWPVEFRIATDAEDLASLARSAASEAVSRVFALGGDGTFQVVLNSLIHSGIPLGILPAGGGNDFALALGLPADPVESAHLLRGGEIRELDVACAKFPNGGRRYFTGGGGIGLDAAAARIASGEYRWMRGRLRYVLAALRALVGFRSIPVEAHLAPADAKPPGSATISAEALVLAVLNTPTYGAGLRLAPEADLQDGLLNLVLVEDRSLLRILPLIPGLLLAGELRTHDVYRRQVRRVGLETKVPCDFHADGEILGTTPVEIEVCSKALRVVCPRRGLTSSSYRSSDSG